jgi:hypothetical protein
MSFGVFTAIVRMKWALECVVQYFSTPSVYESELVLGGMWFIGSYRQYLPDGVADVVGGIDVMHSLLTKINTAVADGLQQSPVHHVAVRLGDLAGCGGEAGGRVCVINAICVSAPYYLQVSSLAPFEVDLVGRAITQHRRQSLFYATAGNLPWSILVGANSIFDGTVDERWGVLQSNAHIGVMAQQSWENTPIVSRSGSW